MRTIEKTIYTFSELSKQAQENVINQLSDINVDYNWWEFVYEDAANIADLFGLDIRQQKTKNRKGEIIYNPDITFSLYPTNAAFSGIYRHKLGAAKAVSDYAPQDTELLEIAEKLDAIQTEFDGRISANISITTYANLSVSVEVDNDNYDDENTISDTDYARIEETITDCMQSFATWIETRLQNDYEFYTSREAIIETIQANGYEFDESGNMA